MVLDSDVETTVNKQEVISSLSKAAILMMLDAAFSNGIFLSCNFYTDKCVALSLCYSRARLAALLITSQIWLLVLLIVCAHIDKQLNQLCLSKTYLQNFIYQPGKPAVITHHLYLMTTD